MIALFDNPLFFIVIFSIALFVELIVTVHLIQYVAKRDEIWNHGNIITIINDELFEKHCEDDNATRIDK